MRSPLMSTNDFFECLEQFTVRYVETVRPRQRIIELDK